MTGNLGIWDCANSVKRRWTKLRACVILYYMSWKVSLKLFMLPFIENNEISICDSTKNKFI